MEGRRVCHDARPAAKPPRTVTPCPSSSSPSRHRDPVTPSSAPPADEVQGLGWRIRDRSPISSCTPCASAGGGSGSGPRGSKGRSPTRPGRARPCLRVRERGRPSVPIRAAAGVRPRRGHRSAEDAETACGARRPAVRGVRAPGEAVDARRTAGPSGPRRGLGITAQAMSSRLAVEGWTEERRGRTLAAHLLAACDPEQKNH